MSQEVSILCCWSQTVRVLAQSFLGHMTRWSHLRAVTVVVLWGHHGLTASRALWSILALDAFVLAQDHYNHSQADSEQSHCDTSQDSDKVDFRAGTVELPGQDAIRRNSSVGKLPLVTPVQGDMLQICSPIVLSTYFPCQWGCAPDCSLLPALGSYLGLSLMHHRVVLVLQTPLANTSVAVVLWLDCVDCVYVPFSAQSNLENTTLCVRKLNSMQAQYQGYLREINDSSHDKWPFCLWINLHHTLQWQALHQASNSIIHLV